MMKAVAVPRSARSAVRSAPTGLFDLQVNGFAGVDFQSSRLKAVDLERAVASLRAHRTERILLTLITDSVDRLCAKLERVENFRRASPAIAAMVVGYHLEGPYLSPEAGYCGAHEPSLMGRPSLAEFDRLSAAAGGNIRLMTLAPELPGSVEFIRDLVDRSVRVAIGHSHPDERAVDAAIEAGLSLCTHLGNAVPQQLHRHDNIIQRLLARDELYAAFIPDGLHLPAFTLRNFVRAKPKNRVLFTTDCMSAAASPPGYYRVGRWRIRVGKDKVVRLPGHPRSFGGSSLTMDAAVENVQSLAGWSERDAIEACSSRVARYLGFR